MAHTNRARSGFPAIFRDKNGDKVQGKLTAIGSTAFVQARRRLAKLAGVEVEQTTQSDVIEYLVRGEKSTRDYLKHNPMK